MNFLSDIPLIGGPLAVIVPFLLLLGIVVFVHEYGHYIVGRWCGIKAETFSVGFGKPLFGWTDRHGTRWQIAALPLGGFVKFVGNMDVASAASSDEGLSEEERKHAFHNASILARSLTVVAGPMANFLLSIVLYAAIAFTLGQPSKAPVVGSVDPDFADILPFEPADRITHVGGEAVETWVDMVRALQLTSGEPTEIDLVRDGQQMVVTTRFLQEPVVSQIRPGYPAAQAGVAAGDKIVSVNGAPVKSFHELRVVTAELPLNTEIDLVVERDGAKRTFTFTPDVNTREHPITGDMVEQATMGVSTSSLGGLTSAREARGVVDSLIVGINQTWGIIVMTITFIGDMLFTSADTSGLGGPIGIAQVSASQAEAGLFQFLGLVALLSTSIGLLNLFPIPILDGGHLVFYAAEAIRGRPLGERVMNGAMMVGLSLVLLLMVFATYNDVVRLLT